MACPDCRYSKKTTQSFTLKSLSILVFGLLCSLPANSHPINQKPTIYYKVKLVQPLMPVKKIVETCPIGYLSSNGYCMPISNKSDAAIPVYGDKAIGNCPRGFRYNAGYFLTTKSNKTFAIPMITSMCPRGYIQSGSYCLKR